MALLFLMFPLISSIFSVWRRSISSTTRCHFLAYGQSKIGYPHIFRVVFNPSYWPFLNCWFGLGGIYFSITVNISGYNCLANSIAISIYSYYWLDCISVLVARRHRFYLFVRAKLCFHFLNLYMQRNSSNSPIFLNVRLFHHVCLHLSHAVIMEAGCNSIYNEKIVMQIVQLTLSRANKRYLFFKLLKIVYFSSILCLKNFQIRFHTLSNAASFQPIDKCGYCFLF
jgi:hypothetical protein